MGDMTPTLVQDFGSGAPSASRPCCNDVRGEWKVIPHPSLEGIEFLGPGDVTTTYYLDFIPKGYRITGRFLAQIRIRGTLKCKCMDGVFGRDLSETAVDEPFEFEVRLPIFSQNIIKRLIPGIGWVMLAIDVARAARTAYNIYNLSPELRAQIMEEAGPALDRAIEEITNSADTLCQNIHTQRCPPPDPSELIA